jgi:prolyl-tRNA editing enzyme YbaK/EbsC (Cys-tRNA(Pro) deacylase)
MDESPAEDRTEHAAITRFRAELERRGGTGRIVVLPASVHTAQLAAEALGCEVGAIANSLLFAVPAARSESQGDLQGEADRDCEPLLLLTSGAHRVDTAKVAASLGVGQLTRAKPDFVRRHTGQVIGGVSPFDHPAPVRTYLDPWLRRHDEIWAAAGHPAAVFSSTFEELQQLTGADELEVE